MKAAAVIVILAGVLGLYAGPLEDWIESSDKPEELQEWLDELARSPIDLNTASARQLAELPFFDMKSAGIVIAARNNRGGFRVLEEALAAEGLNDVQREILQRFTVVVFPAVTEVSQSVRVNVSGRSTEPEPDENGLRSRVRGDFNAPDRAAGFVSGQRQPEDADLFDEISAGIDLPARGGMPRLVLGDFQQESGTGLVFASSFGIAHWTAAAEQLQPSAAGRLRARPAADRRAVFRGAAAEMKFPSTTVTILWSRQWLDAAQDGDNITRITEGDSPSSMELKLARDDRLEESAGGFTAFYSRRNWQTGVAAIRSVFKPAVVSGENEWPALSGSNLSVGSVFFRGTLNRVNCLTEFAASDPGGSAHQTALSFSGNSIGCTAYHIYAAEDFHSLHSKVWGGFGEEAQNVRITGVRLRTVLPRQTVVINGWTSRTPFRTATVPLRKSAQALEVKWRLAFSSEGALELLTGRRYREETNGEYAGSSLRTDRLRADLIIDRPQRIKLRYELRSVKEPGYGSHRMGSLLFAQGKSRWLWLDAFLRVTLFHFENSDVAIGLYENTVSGSYPLVSLSGTGHRAALMITGRRGFWSGGIKIARTVSSVINEQNSAVEAAVSLSINR